MAKKNRPLLLIGVAMAWMSLEDAAKSLGCSRRTLERKLKSEEVASYYDNGRRMVWVGKEPKMPIWVEELLREVKELRGEVALLKGPTTSIPRPVRKVQSPQPLPERPAQALPRVRFSASRPKKAPAAESRPAPTAEEENAVALLRRLVKAAGGQGALSRRSGIPQPSISKWLSGKRYPSEEFRATLAKLAKELGLNKRGEAQAA